MPNDKESSYWTLAELVRWIGTRDQDLTVNNKAIENDVIGRCRNGSIRAVGRRCIWPDPYSQYSIDLRDQMRWASAVSAGGHPSDIVETIPPHEWMGLDWQPKNDGGLPDSLRSTTSGWRRWVTVRFARLDVMRAYTRQRAGRPPKKYEAAKKMRRAIEQKEISREELATMPGKELAHRFSVGRTTATIARKDVLGLLESVANSISDK